MWTAAFWKATAERVIRAFALAFLATIGGGTVADVRAIDWRAALLVAALTAGLNLLVSLAAGAGIGPRGSPSLVRDPAAAAPADPVVTLADHDRRAQRADLAERLHQHEPGQHRNRGGYTGSTPAEDVPPPQKLPWPEPGEHRELP